MGSFSRTLLVACALVAGPGTGVAGQLSFPPQPVVPVPAAVPIPDYSPWYLRGDIGFALNEDPDISRAAATFSGAEMDESWSFGAGLGYNFGDNLRGDITVDHRFEADLNSIDPATGAANRTTLASTVILANLYYDFRDRNHFTPYVGLGLGVTNNELDEQSGATASDFSFDLAAAAMAGFSYRLRNEWTFDAGYRFLYLGEAQTEAIGATNALSVDDIYSHELRIGFRYDLN